MLGYGFRKAHLQPQRTVTVAVQVEAQGPGWQAASQGCGQAGSGRWQALPQHRMSLTSSRRATSPWRMQNKRTLVFLLVAQRCYIEEAGVITVITPVSTRDTCYTANYILLNKTRHATATVLISH